jgi:threonine dehydrogenase-like Zn-dependent dehydrogenase
MACKRRVDVKALVFRHSLAREAASCGACQDGRYPWCRNFRSGSLPASIHLGNCAAAAGAHAERFAAHVSQLFAIPDGISDEAAVLADPVSVSLRSILLAPPPSRTASRSSAGTRRCWR